MLEKGRNGDCNDYDTFQEGQGRKLRKRGFLGKVVYQASFSALGKKERLKFAKL